MNTELTIGRLNITLRECDRKDESFVYELMYSSLGELFNRNTKEGWSRKKFRIGFSTSRIMIAEHEEMSIGFIDLERKGDELLFHTACLSKDYQNKSIGSKLERFFSETANTQGVKLTRVKVFRDNERSVRFCLRQGYLISQEIGEENSYLLEKSLV